jgi:hypothetical protein
MDSLNQSLLQEFALRKELNASREIKVNERTAEIRSLLQHILQGIITIGEGGIIAPAIPRMCMTSSRLHAGAFL